MSLLSEWNTDKNNMNVVLNKSSDIHGGTDSGSTSTSDADYLENLMNKARKNQWKCTKFPYNGSADTSPTVSWMRQYISTALHYRNQDTSQNWDWGDSYTGIRECWVYMNAQTSVSTTLWTDDAGALFINGSSVATSTSCTNKSVSFTLRKGLNHILIAFSEYRGGDGGYITTNPVTLSNCKWGYAEFALDK